MQNPLRLAMCLLLGVGASACLSSTHSIPQADLHALAQRPLSERGHKVRVVQTFSGSEQPPEAPREVSGSLTIRDGHRPRGSHSGSRGTKSRSRKGSSGGGSFSLRGLDGDAAAVLAVVVVAGAAVIAVVAASSEGMRYDGWAHLSDEHPVHLYGPQKSYKMVPLRELTVEDAQWAERAYVRESEGPWRSVGRAPLNRQGWAYSVFLGAGKLGDAMSSPSSGTVSHIQLGYFPVHGFGLHADLGFAWGEANGAEDTSSRFAASAGLEAQLLPFQSGRFHAGGFGQVAQSVRTRSAGGGRGAVYSSGVLMQLDLTTRLAVSARAGFALSHGEFTNEMSLGLSIY